MNMQMMLQFAITIRRFFSVKAFFAENESVITPLLPERNNRQVCIPVDETWEFLKARQFATD